MKTYLLPDKSKESKKKTNFKRKTVNPEWNEKIKVDFPLFLMIFANMKFVALLRVTYCSPFIIHHIHL